MEKEAEDVCSPDTVLEDFLKSNENEKDGKQVSLWAGFVQLLRSKSKRRLSTLHPLNAHILSKRFSASMREGVGGAPPPDASLNYIKPPCKSFSLCQLKVATVDFSQGNMIGKGGYALVYKGCLPDGQLVAVKRLTRGSPDERIRDFLSELGIMAHINHPNTAKLIGYGVEGGLYLVLELSPLGSLASQLHDSKEGLKWDVRHKVALGTAKGLLYLHDGCQRRIIHRDIKSANILLTKDFEPQICDFGLAKWLPQRWSHLTICEFEGTFGYVAPEFLMHGIVDEKTDIYAFGVLLLELITGRRALDHSEQSLVMWAKPLLEKNKIRELVDPKLGDDYGSLQMNLMILAASLCLKESSVERPTMTEVILLLKGRKCPRATRSEGAKPCLDYI